MINILISEARQNKKLILLYLTLCIVSSVLLSPCIGNIHSVNAAEQTLTEEETVDSLMNLFTGKAIVKLSGSYSQIVGVSAEPFTALLFIGIIENVNRWVGSPMDVASTPAGNPVVLILVFIFFVASKIMRSNEATEIFGMVTLGEIEKYLGLAFLIALGVLNVVGISTTAAGEVNAAALSEVGATAGNVISYSVSIISSIVLGLISLVVYYIVKTAMWGLNALQVSISFIPGSAFVIELMKTVMVCFLVTINVIFPKIGFAINIFIFLLCCVFFKISYSAMQYFKKIYLIPMWRQFGGFEPNEALVHKRVPKKIKKAFINEAGDEILLAIPVYALKSVYAEIKVKRYDKWWLIKQQENMWLCKKRWLKKDIKKINLTNSEEQPFYFRKGIRFFEVFDLLPGELEREEHWYKRKKRHYAFAFSREYKYRYEDILKLSEYIAYADVKEEQKMQKKQARLDKKAEKRALKVAKKEAKQIIK